jgi:hypothetical protein
MMRAALVNLETSIVESVIVVNSVDDIVPEGYQLVETDMIVNNIGKTDEELALYEIIKDLDPDYKYDEIERPIHIGQTKWSVSRGFYEE